MHVLDVTTVFVVGLMVGNELAVSLFINPAVWRLDDGAMAAELARSLGRAMPFWYGLCLVLLAVEAWLHWHGAGRGLMLAATLLWAGAIAYTLAALVPLNNRVAAGDARWLELTRSWDLRHRVRIVLLAVAFGCFLAGM